MLSRTPSNATTSLMRAAWAGAITASATSSATAVFQTFNRIGMSNSFVSAYDYARIVPSDENHSGCLVKVGALHPPRASPILTVMVKKTASLVATRPVESLIHVIRGQKVMLDSDLAALYWVQTKRLNEAVRRNLNRFPTSFMFQLTPDEAARMRSQFATSSKRNITIQPLAFTEHGVVMLSKE
jgi:hypothetical protein